MKKGLKKQKENKKGFTLVEMIVVIAIIGVLVAMMVPSLLGYIEKANTSNNVTAVNTIVRTAQVALVELNDTQSTLIKGAPRVAEVPGDQEIPRVRGVDITVEGGNQTSQDALEDSIEALYTNEKFEGSFIIQVQNGVVEKALYDSKGTKAPEFTVASKSDKQYGYYE